MLESAIKGVTVVSVVVVVVVVDEGDDSFMEEQSSVKQVQINGTLCNQVTSFGKRDSIDSTTTRTI